MDTGLSQAIMDLKQAEQNFEYAAPDFIEIAVIQLLAAKMRFDSLYRARKQNGPDPMD